MKKLIIAGMGIKFLSHLSHEAHQAIKHSDCVLYLVNEPAMKEWLSLHAKHAISLDEAYFSCQSRRASYQKIEQQIEHSVEQFDLVCLLVYGHPLFFSSAAAGVIASLRKKDISVEVQPAVSSLDCLFADLEVDPASTGFQCHDATAFISRRQGIHTDTALILLQVGVIGLADIISDDSYLVKRRPYLCALVTQLINNYGANHPCILYVGSQYPGLKASIQRLTLGQLLASDIQRTACLYLPGTSS